MLSFTVLMTAKVAASCRVECGSRLLLTKDPNLGFGFRV